LGLDKEVDDLFAHRFDYIDWIELKREDPETIGFLEPEWNDFDHSDSRGRRSCTRPSAHAAVESGLPIDYTLRERGPLDFLRRWKRKTLTSSTRPQPGSVGLLDARRPGRSWRRQQAGVGRRNGG
jgi:hypothetical protein